MTTRTRLVAVAAALALLPGCAAGPEDLVVAGTVDASLQTVAAPALPVPAVNLDAGFSTLTGAFDPVSGRTSPRASQVAATWSVGTTVRIADVQVRVGDRVTVGQPLANVDTAPLTAQLAATRADAKVLAAQVDVLTAALDTIADKETDLEDTRDELNDALDTLHDTRAKLLKARAQLRSTRPKLVEKRTQLVTAREQAQTQRAQLAAQLAQLEAQLPEHPELQPQVDQLRAAIAGIDAALKKLAAGIKALTAGLAKVDAGLRKIAKALPQLAAGRKKINSGLKKLDDATATLSDRRGSVRDAREVLRIQASAATVPTAVVKAQLLLADLVSPVAGVVVSTATVGTRVAPGATVVTIREEGPATVTVWLSPAQLDQVCSGDPATVTGDWSGTAVPATVTRIGTRADYPPTSVATTEVHLTRAVQVQLTADAELPAGAPVETSIQSCRTAADSTR